jgi:2-keto-4-pentenoate hydratase/2-oxohepta-3-ene-1,7-dioic acid hydratase in catechol pathway
MKLATFESGQGNRIGVIKGEQVGDIGVFLHLLAKRSIAAAEQPGLQAAVGTLLAAGPPPQDMIALLERGDSWLAALDEVVSAVAEGSESAGEKPRVFIPVESVRLRAPISRPGKIACVGLNYALHAREQDREPPRKPVFFLKSNNTICGPGDPIVLPINSNEVDYEAEFAVVIGKRGKRIPVEKAFEHIVGYTILNDVTARDMQYGDRQWFRGKSCDTFGPTGPWIVTKDEIPDPENLRISLTLNGKTMQDSRTSDLIFKIPFLVSYLSQSLTWEVGDVLSTGTPGGVGRYRQPPVYLQAGDNVSVTVEKIGTLSNPVVGPEFEGV